MAERRPGQSDHAFPFAIETAQLVAPFPLDECIRRLRDDIAPFWAPFGGRRLVGRLSGTSLRVRKPVWTNHWLQTRLFATLVDAGDRTRIVCRFTVHPLVKAFMAIWFSGVVLLGGTIFLLTLAGLMTSSPRSAPGNGERWIGLIVPPAMLLLGAALVGFGRWRARDERQYLLDALRAILDARPE
jgi:hypothetical protein